MNELVRAVDYLEESVLQLRDTIQQLTDRVEVLEKEMKNKEPKNPVFGRTLDRLTDDGR